MTLKDQLLSVSDAFASAAGLSRSRVSTIVLNRGSTLEAIAAGKADVTTSTFEKAMLWFSERWPAGVEWPAGVDRPQTERSAPAHHFDGDAFPAVAPGPDAPEPGPGISEQPVQEAAE